MSEKLKPCPFCGGEAVYDKDIAGYFFVCCPSDECNTQVASYHYPSLEEAINAWNTRVEAQNETQA